MLFFLVGAAFVHAVVLGITLRVDPGAFVSTGHVVGLLLNLVAVPLGAAWMTAEALNFASPRRLLHARVHCPGQRLLAGVMSGGLTTVGTIAGISWLTLGVPDGRITAMASAVATLLVLVLTRRVRRLHCPACDYDLNGLAPSGGGVCTECGFMLVEGSAGAPVSRAVASHGG